MAYGINGLKLPEQNQEIVRRLCYRWVRALNRHQDWAQIAKRCVNFLEGDQWSEEEKAIL